MVARAQERGRVDALVEERSDQLVSLSSLSSAVAKASTPEETYRAALDCLFRTLSPDRASVLLFDDDGVMRFRAWRGLSDAYRAATEGHSPWSPDTKDPRPILVADVADEPSLAELRPVIEREGIRALGFFPLLAQDRLLGKFMVYFDRPRVFTPMEVRLVQAIGAHIALEISRRQLDDSLREQSALLQTQSELASEGILVVSPDGRVVFCNRAYVEMWGLAPDVVESRSHAAALEAVAKLVVDPPRFLDRVAHVYEQPEERGRDEVVLLDGRVFDRQTSPIRSSEGVYRGRVWLFQDVTESRRSADRSALLAEASELLAQSLDYHETLEGLATLVVSSLADVCRVELVEDDRLVQRAAATSGSPRAGELEAELRGLSLGARVVERGKTEMRGDTVVCLPLRARGQTLGVISLAAGRRFSPADLDLAQDLARRAGLAIDNGLLHAEERRARDAAERLQTLTAAFGRSLTQQEVASLVVREAAASMGAAAGWISLVDRGREHLQRQASVGYDPELDEAYSELPLDRRNPTVDALLGERPLWFDSAEAVVEAYPLLEADYRATGFEAMGIVPVPAAGGATGVIVLNFVEPRAFGEHDRGLLLAIAAQCGQALERAGLHAALQERADAASVLAHVGDGVFQLEDDERVTLWNRGAEVLTGIAESDALGSHIGELFAGWELIRPRISITDLPLAVGRREALPVTVGERELWLAISGVAAGDSIVYAFRDVTEAEHLEQVRRDFLSTVSHELRTPLAAVYGATKTLLNRQLEKEMHSRLLQIIDTESERLGRLLDDLLLASRLDEGGIELEPGSCDVAELVREVIDLQRPSTPANITLTLDAPAGVPRAACNGARLKQVLLNLVDNAIKYSPDGGAITVTLGAEGDRVQIAVTDEGLGVPLSEQERIFEKFYRLDPQLSRGVGGTGLGLYISRELVERMQGRIGVQSDEGRGSTFVVDVPAASSGPQP